MTSSELPSDDENNKNLINVGANIKKQAISQNQSKSRNFGLDISNKPKENPSTSSTSKPQIKRPKLKLKENPLKNVDFWDLENLKYPQQVALYAGSITNHMKSLENNTCYMVDPDYINQQSDVNSKMRKILVEWLIEVHNRYRMVQEVLHLCVNIIDRFMSSNRINREKLQLLGISALLIASKFEEIYPPSVHRFIYLSENAVDLEEILEMEGKILCFLDFRLLGPSTNKFFERFAEIFNMNETGRLIGKCLLDLALIEYKCLKYKKSLLAASAVIVALRILGINIEEKEQKEKMGYDKEELEECSKLLCYLMLKCIKSGKFTSVRKKYGGNGGLNILTMFN